MPLGFNMRFGITGKLRSKGIRFDIFAANKIFCYNLGILFSGFLPYIYGQ